MLPALSYAQSIYNSTSKHFDFLGVSWGFRCGGVLVSTHNWHWPNSEQGNVTVSLTNPRGPLSPMHGNPLQRNYVHTQTNPHSRRQMKTFLTKRLFPYSSPRQCTLRGRKLVASSRTWGSSRIDTDNDAEATHCPPFLTAAVGTLSTGYLNSTRSADEQAHLDSRRLRNCHRVASGSGRHVARDLSRLLAALTGADLDGDMNAARRA